MTGVLALILLVAALWLAAGRGRRRWLPAFSGAEAALATALSALALLVFELELLGAIGWFRTVPILVFAVFMAAASWLLTRGSPTGSAGEAGGREAFGATPGRNAPQAPPTRPIPPPAPPRAALALAGLATAAVAVAWLGPTQVSLRYGIHQFDSIWYHLPWAATFARSGHVTPVQYRDVEYLTAFYPATAEMLHALGIVLLGSDVLSPLINLGWLALALLGGWCIGARRGAGHLTLLGALVALATPMVVSSQAGSADNDIAATALLLCAAGLLPGALSLPRVMPLAAVAAGLALGTKLTAVPAALLLSLATLATAPRGDRRATALRWLVPLILAGGYWYVRDWVAVGTPFPWLKLPSLPVPAAPLQSYSALSVAHYLLHGKSPGVHVWHALEHNLGTAWPALLSAFAVVAVLAWRRPDTRLLGGVALLAALAYLVMPQSAPGPAGHPVGFIDNVRYLTPALTLALALSGAVLPRRVASPLLGALLVLDLARADQWSSGPQRALIGVAVVAVIALAVVLPRLLRGRAARPVAALVALVALVIAAAPLQRAYLRVRYSYRPHISSLSPVWLAFRSIAHARVAVSGTYGGFFTYPLFGLHDTNSVAYIAARGPHGSFTPITSCRRWIATVNAGHYQYLLNAPDRNVWAPARLLPTPSAGWVKPGPGARLIYRAEVTGRPVTLWRLSGPLPANACPRGQSR